MVPFVLITEICHYYGRSREAISCKKTENPENWINGGLKRPLFACLKKA
jgi:hypothetical protein